MAEQPRGGRGGIILAAALIIIGLGFLAANLGLIPTHWWRSLWRLWPLLLVLLGLDLILGWRRGWGGVALALLVALLVIGGGLVVASWQGYLAPWAFGERISETVAQELGDLEEAAIEVEFGAGELSLRALPRASPWLIRGDLRHPGDGRAGQEFHSSRGRGIFRLVGPEGGDLAWWGEGAQWDLTLTRRIPLGLTVKAGAARVEIDLRDLMVRDVRLDLGVSASRVRFPKDAGLTTALVKAGASSLTLEIPEGVAARIEVNLGLASLDIDQGRFPGSGGSYLSPDYDSAENRLDLEVDAGAASVTIR